MKPLYDRIQRIAGGDASASTWFYDTFAATLHRRLLQRYRFFSEEQVEDLVHDTFVLFLRRGAQVLKQFAERDSEALSERTLERYLWDRACGLAVNRRRSAGHTKVVSIEPWDQGKGASEESAAISRDALAKLDRCLRGAATQVYLYYKLRYWDGLSPNEISRTTGWPQKKTYRTRQELNSAVVRCLRRLGLKDSTP
ncbi:MAG: hypothetical protein AAGM22_07200 [Acidobacteriota bacterium]